MSAASTIRVNRDDLDRLWVWSAGGERLGWHDLRTARTHLADPGAGPVVADAVGRHLAACSPLRRRRVVTGLVGPQRGPSPAELTVPDLREQAPAERTTRELLRRLDASPAGAASPLGRGGRRWFLSALGQQHVGRLLQALPATWQVLHSLPMGGDVGGLHHLLLGPAGLVVVRTVHEPSARVRSNGRTLRVDGRPADDLRVLARHSAEVAGRLGLGPSLVVPVRQVLVVSDARSIEVHERPRATTVLGATDLIGWLQDRPTVVSTVLVERLTRRAADPDTWPGDADGAVDLLTCTQREQRRASEQGRLRLLRREVRRAGHVRAARLRGAALALTAVAVGALALVVQPLLPRAAHPAVQQVLAALL